MTISKQGLDLVKSFEGLYLDAYRDEVGVWTIGYGHTGLQHRDGTVFSGRVITRAKADELLAYDMHQFEQRANTLVTVPLTQSQFDAIVSFDFNTGGLAKSTLLKLLNKGDFFGAAGEFDKWNKAGGTVLKGLTRRRHAERDLFCGFNPQQWLT